MTTYIYSSGCVDVINLVQMWIGINLLDGVYAVRLVTKQTLDYVKFILYYIHGSIYLLWM